MTISAPRCPWTPPTGVASVLLPAGVWWDAVRVPQWAAAAMLAELGTESGAVIRDGYTGQHTWLTTPGAVDGWAVPEYTQVQLLYATTCLEVPPLRRTGPLGVHWHPDRRWGDRQLTDPFTLHVALDNVLRDTRAVA